MATSSPTAIEEPRAPERPQPLLAHGELRLDPWFWLRERDSPEVRAYLEAENAYFERATGGTRELAEEIYRELVGRLAPDDTTAPWSYRGRIHYARYEEGRDYAVHCRRTGSMAGAEEVLLDGNELARGTTFFQLVEPKPSPSGRYLAFACDTIGRRQFTLRIKDLATGELLPEVLEAATPNLVWAADDRTLFYVRQDAETLRWHRVFRHRLGEEPGADGLVFDEPDPAYSVTIGRTRSEKFLIVRSAQTLATEVRVLAADRPDDELRLVEPRRRGHEYEVDHQDGPEGGRFLVRTNDRHRNFRLVEAPIDAPGATSWSELVAARDDVFLEDAQPFDGAILLAERSGGQTRLRLLDDRGRELRELGFGEPAYLVAPDDKAETGGPLRFVYSSLTTPNSIYEETIATGERSLLWRERILGGFDPAKYRSERLWAPTADGKRVPISLVMRADARPDGTAPLLLEGYGAYGLSNEPSFDLGALSLVDRGFVFAIAHVRGGQELGRAWYEEGRQRAKRNTFTDFIDAAEFLAREGWAARDRMYAFGGSAGGLLIGAVLNQRPDLFDGAVAVVPFVDVVTTMMDPTIPLTTGEYDEWGDPEDPEQYAYLLSYSPYDNVAPKPYPHILVMTGFHDSQVQYWEPAKWVAKLRALRTDRTKQLLLRTNFEAGHGGASGRYRRLRERAIQFAFLVALARRPAGAA